MAYTTINKSTIILILNFIQVMVQQIMELQVLGSTNLVWIKNRTSTYWHQKYDVIRGVNKSIASNSNNVQENRQII